MQTIEVKPDPKRFGDGSLVRVLVWHDVPGSIQDLLKWSLYRAGLGEPDYLILTPVGADKYTACAVADALASEVFHTYDKVEFDGTKCSIAVAGRSR